MPGVGYSPAVGTRYSPSEYLREGCTSLAWFSVGERRHVEWNAALLDGLLE